MIASFEFSGTRHVHESVSRSLRVLVVAHHSSLEGRFYTKDTSLVITRGSRLY